MTEPTRTRTIDDAASTAPPNDQAGTATPHSDSAAVSTHVPGEGGADAAPPVGPPGYTLGAEIGRGGMGVVYRARDRGIGRDVAVKLLQERFAPTSGTAARFVEEARITGQLQHPGIPAVYQVGELPGGRPYLAMKLIKGDTLDDLLKAGPVNHLAVFEGLCQAVGYAHAHGVIHRDLKPANVMVGAFGEVQVMDWGLAKVLANRASDGTGVPDADESVAPTAIHSARDSDTPFTQYGSVMGTPAYMSPEQAGGETDKIDRRSDVFGLGAVLCKLLTGQPPFTGKDADSVRLNAVRGRTEGAFTRLDASGADPDVIALCKRCLSFEPDGRPASANEVAQAVADLRRAADERARQAERDKLAAEVREGEQRKRRRAVQRAGGVVAAVLLLGIAGTAVGLVQANQARRDEATQRGEAETQRDKAVTAEKLAEARLVQVTAEQQKTEEQREIAEAETKVALAVQKFLRVKLLGQASAAAQANNLLLAGRPADDAKPNPTIRELLDRAAVELTPERIEKNFPEPTVQATILIIVAGSYQSIGVYPPAVAMLERALALRREHLPPDHPNTLSTATELGTALYEVGKLEAARRLLEDTRERMAATLGEGDVRTLVTTSNLAKAYADLAKPEKAVALLEEVRARMRAVWGPSDPEYMVLLNNLGVGYSILHQYDAARPLLEEALRLREEHLGLGHPDTIHSLDNLAATYSAAGLLDKALPLWERALPLCEKKNGPDHPTTLHTMNNLAAGYWSVGRLDKSVPLFEETVKRRRAKFGNDNPDLLNTVANLGVNYRDAGRVDEAIPLLEEAYRKRGRNARLAWVANALVATYITAGKTPEATKLVREQLAEARGLLTPGGPQLGSQLAVSGNQLLTLGAFADAEASLRECLELREKLVEKKQVLAWQVANTRALLGQALVGLKKYADAEPLLTAGYAGLVADEKLVPLATRPNIGDTARALVSLYTATDRPEKAAAWKAKIPRETLPRPRAEK